MRTLGFVVAAAVAVAAAASAAASTITYVGTLTDTAAAWRTASAANAAFALTPADIFGRDGYFLPGGEGVALRPGYVTAFGGSSNVFGGNAGYAAIDNPLTTPGATPTTLVTGTFNPFPGTGGTATTFAFTVGANAPALIRVGILTDNLDVAGFDPAAVQLVSSVAGASPDIDLTGAAANDGRPDLTFFDIRGGVAGETFVVTTTGGSAGCACVGGVAFDSAAVPEPRAWSLMLAGFGLIGTVARRRPATVAA